MTECTIIYIFIGVVKWRIRINNNYYYYYKDNMNDSDRNNSNDGIIISTVAVR